MKITKSQLQQIIKEELTNERIAREKTPAALYLRKIEDYFEEVDEDQEDGRLVPLAPTNTPEHRKAAKEWLDLLQKDREDSGDLFDQLAKQRAKIEKDIMRLNVANKNLIALQQFVSGKSGSGKAPKFTKET